MVLGTKVVGGVSGVGGVQAAGAQAGIELGYGADDDNDWQSTESPCLVDIVLPLFTGKLLFGKLNADFQQC